MDRSHNRIPIRMQTLVEKNKVSLCQDTLHSSQPLLISKQTTKIQTWRYNMPTGVYTRSEESLLHIRKLAAQNHESNRGKQIPEHTRMLIRKKLTGTKASPETKQKLSDMRKGEKCYWFGKTHTQETKDKISKNRAGIKMSDEWYRKMKECHQNPVFTPERCQHISESLRGEKHPNWKGGVSFLPYCFKFNKEFKTRVRDFFGNRCVLCGKTKKENGRELTVHHVNYDKQTCCNNSKPLFVCLCNSHNIKVNKNRKYWECCFTQLIYVIYDGKCYLEKS